MTPQQMTQQLVAAIRERVPHLSPSDAALAALAVAKVPWVEYVILAEDAQERGAAMDRFHKESSNGR